MAEGFLVKPSPGFTCGPRALLVLTEPDFRFFGKVFLFARRTRLFLSEVLYDERGALLGPALGAPQVAMLMENLRTAGVREILLLGWAGALTSKIPLRSIFLSQKALALEGTSRLYFPRRRVFFPERNLFQRFKTIFLRLGLPFKEGAVVSTDAPYREDEVFLEKYGRRYEAVDMETSAALAVGGALELSVVACHFISDRLTLAGRQTVSSRELRACREALIEPLRTFLEGE